MAADPTSLYRQSLLENAPPIKIVRLLYEKAISHLERARRLDLSIDGKAFSDALSKADAIIVELRLSLDPTPAPDVAASLEGLYLFCEDELMHAMAERKSERVGAVIDVLNKLLSAWRSVEINGAGAKAA